MPLPGVAQGRTSESTWPSNWQFRSKQYRRTRAPHLNSRPNDFSSCINGGNHWPADRVLYEIGPYLEGLLCLCQGFGRKRGLISVTENRDHSSKPCFWPIKAQ